MYRYHCLMIRAHLIEFSHRLIIVMYYCVFIVRPRAVSRHFYLLLNSFVIKVISLWNSTFRYFYIIRILFTWILPICFLHLGYIIDVITIKIVYI
jgi:hypothetical protein